MKECAIELYQIRVKLIAENYMYRVMRYWSTEILFLTLYEGCVGYGKCVAEVYQNDAWTRWYQLQRQVGQIQIGFSGMQEIARKKYKTNCETDKVDSQNLLSPEW